MQTPHQQLHHASEEAQQNCIVRVPVQDLLVRHQGQQSCGAESDVLAGPEHDVDETPHERGVEAVLRTIRTIFSLCLLRHWDTWDK